jgi:hypothetical protein
MRQRFTQFLLLSCAALSLSACVTVTPEHVPLAAGARDAIASTEIVAPVAQSEIYVFVPDSQLATNGGGGLLLALIDAGVDSARTHNAETAVKPVRDALVDYNFDEKLRNDLHSSLSQVSFLHVGDARVIKEVLPKNIDQAITDSKGAAVLVVGADYHLSNDGSQMTVTVAADMFANNTALTPFKPAKGNAKIKSAAENALYRTKLVYSETIPGATTKRDENVPLWTADNGKALRGTLDRATADLSRRLAADLDGKAVIQTAADAGQ